MDRKMSLRIDKLMEEFKTKLIAEMELMTRVIAKPLEHEKTLCYKEDHQGYSKDYYIFQTDCPLSIDQFFYKPRDIMLY